MRTLVSGLCLALIASTSAAAQAAVQSRSTPTMPAAGEMAPDFSAPVAGRNGVETAPVTLSKLRGRVVVLAFYPGDRTPGCTAELTKFTQEYATMFGDGVVVLPISKDGLASHASWAKDMGMPFNLISDTAGAVARLYASQSRPGAGFTRNVFVIGKDGKIALAISRLNALSEEAYAPIKDAVAAAKK